MRFPYALYKVSGHSMKPNFNPGDKILVFAWAYIFGKPKAGEVVVFKVGGEVWVKRLVKVEAGGWRVEGDNKKDSLNLKQLDSQMILGRVILRIPN